MSAARIAIGEEVGKSRAFAWAVDWPGWCRSARNRLELPSALIAAAPRYAIVVATAGLDFIPDLAGLNDDDFGLIDTAPASAGTDFGVPGSVAEDDRRPLTEADAVRLSALVAAAWRTLDAVVAGAPPELRKGPRGGGRDLAKMVDHCVISDSGYAGQMGIRLKDPDPTDRPSVEEVRAAILDVLRRPSDGSPIAGRRWPPRYAARRIAWHALDHAWEIQDKS